MAKRPNKGKCEYGRHESCEPQHYGTSIFKGEHNLARERPTVLTRQPFDKFTISLETKLLILYGGNLLFLEIDTVLQIGTRSIKTFRLTVLRERNHQPRYDYRNKHRDKKALKKLVY
jgi:hypothetical protein